MYEMHFTPAPNDRATPRRLAQHFVNNLWAIASTVPFYGVTIKGAENLPAASSPAVYVANHQSFMVGWVGMCFCVGCVGVCMHYVFSVCD
jgi:1-acyl-sn-glycerol-3-phosphate acyltransferase